MKFAIPQNRAIVYNPQTGRNLPEAGEYVTPDQHFIRRVNEGSIKLLDKRPAPPRSVKPATPKTKDNK